VASTEGGVAVDVAKLIDGSGLSRLQIAVVLLCGLVAILDGADTTSIAIATSTIAGMLNFPVSAFGLVFAAGTLGAMLGAMTFGLLADRFGRKRLLVAATILFGIFTLLIAHAQSYSTLVLYRIIAGFGLGGATPCFLALVSEYVPRQVRGTVVSVLWATFPFGIMLGGFLNSYLVTAFSWQMIFYVGGAIPLVVAALLTVMLPESLQFLIGRGEHVSSQAHPRANGSWGRASRYIARRSGEAPFQKRSRSFHGCFVGSIFYGFRSPVGRRVFHTRFVEPCSRYSFSSFRRGACQRLSWTWCAVRHGTSRPTR
jgi:MFS family permease